jgi:hypothetical protein
MFRLAGWLAGAGVLLAGIWMAGRRADLSAEPSQPANRVVIAELFTSEGCSSCPPADEELSRLQTREAPNVEVAALGEHVDYWDSLGWRDRFSSASFSARQSDYDARVFKTGSIYTPQLVIDGHLQMVGSDHAAIQRAIDQAARSRKSVVVVQARTDAHDVRVEIAVEVPDGVAIGESTELVVAITENKLATDVRRGENGGRILKHDAVVRSLQTMGVMPVHQRAWRTSASIPMGADWRRENIRAVAFLQERASRRIVGAGASTVK